MNFLITGYYFDGFHGSMLHIAELAETLITKDFNVYIASVEITKEIKLYIESICAKLYFVEDLPLDIEYDYVLAYHEPILTYLLKKGLKCKHIGVGSLSAFELKEFPSLLVKYNIPLFVHSEKLGNYWNEQLQIPKENIFVLPNSVPERFNRIEHKTKELNSVAIVSSHIPKEIFESIELLKKQNITVDIYGKGYNYTLITPEILNKYDVIITIGKTVQYSLYMGIPVYCYDKWGGVGYIVSDNIKEEEFDNFAGRSGKKMSKNEIANDIISNYQSTISQMSEITGYIKEHFSLEKNINNLIENLSSSQSIPDTAEWKIYKTHCYTSMLDIIRLKKITNSNKQLCYFVYNFLNKITFGKFFKNKAELAIELNKYILK